MSKTGERIVNRSEIACDYRMDLGMYSWCDLSDNPCILDSNTNYKGDECDYYNDLISESEA